MSNDTHQRKLAIWTYRLMPKSLISRIFGIIAAIPLPQSFLTRIIRWYSAKYSVADEYIVPEKGFKNLNGFFTRRLKEGARRIDLSPQSVVSPVDARVDQFGRINQATMIQAKGINYSVRDLVPSKAAEQYINGSFITLYLSPGDYHRIHSPVSGAIKGYFNIPGKLYTVQEFMVRGLRNLFAINERIISYIETPNGMVSVCMVGATNVGKITLSFDSQRSNKTFRRRKELFYPTGNEKPVKAGDELGIFNLGSTVILLTEKELSFDNLAIGNKIRMGEKIGSFLP